MYPTTESSSQPEEYTKKSSAINLTALFTWIAVFIIMVVFWSGIAITFKKDYIPQAIVKIEHKEKRFLANHKALQKKFFGFRNSLL